MIRDEQLMNEVVDRGLPEEKSCQTYKYAYIISTIDDEGVKCGLY